MLGRGRGPDHVVDGDHRDLAGGSGLDRHQRDLGGRADQRLGGVLLGAITRIPSTPCSRRRSTASLTELWSSALRLATMMK